jgi:hypothetical protein
MNSVIVCITDIKYRTVYVLIHIIICFLQIGGTYMKPLILPSQVAIGALGKIQVMSL